MRYWGPERVHNPYKWAKYGRPETIRSGSQLLEAWHFRLKNESSFWLKKEESIDHLVRELYDEWIYYFKTITNSTLLEQKRKEIANSKQKYHRRITLRSFINSDGTKNYPQTKDCHISSIQPEHDHSSITLSDGANHSQPNNSL